MCAQWGSIQQAAAYTNPNGLSFVVCRYGVQQSASQALKAAQQVALHVNGISLQIMAWQGPVALAMARRVDPTTAPRPAVRPPHRSASPDMPPSHPLSGIIKDRDGGDDTTMHAHGATRHAAGDGQAGFGGQATWYVQRLTGSGRLSEAAAWVLYWCILRNGSADEEAARLRAHLLSSLTSLQVRHLLPGFAHVCQEASRQPSSSWQT